jgi:predicted RND superfamily exporter protein
VAGIRLRDPGCAWNREVRPRETPPPMLNWILFHPRVVLGLILAATIGFGMSAARVQIDPSVEGMILEDNPDLVYYREFLERFGSDELVIIGLRAPRLFERAPLEMIRHISHALREITLEADPGIENPTYLIDRVVSLTNANQIRNWVDADGEHVLVVNRLIRKIPASREAVAELWSRATGDPLFVGNFLSAPEVDDPDAPLTTLILARIVDRPGDLHYRSLLKERVEAILRDALANAPGVEASFRLAGIAILKATLGEQTKTEMWKTDALSWLVNFAILLLIFRTRMGIALPLLAVACGAVWTVGFLTLCGSRINILSIVVVPLIKVVGVATAVHVFSGYYEGARITQDPRELTERTIRRVLLPCFLASFTTALGFLALATSKIVTVREVGIYSAFGVMATWLITTTIIPILLLRVRPPTPETSGIRGIDRYGAALDRLSSATIRFRWPIFVGSIGLLVFTIAGISRLKVETDVLEYFRPEHPVRSAHQAIRGEIGGVQPLDIAIRATPGGALEPAVLEKVDRLQSWLTQQPEIDHTLSIVDYLKRLNQEINGGSPEFHRIPDSAQQAANLLFVFDSGGEGRLAAPFLYPSWEEPEEIRVLARINVFNSETLVDLIARCQRYLTDTIGALPEVDPPTLRTELAPGEVAARVTGFSRLYAEMASSLVDGQVKSLALAFVVIWLTVIVLMRSFSAGTLAMIPNLLPILVVLGLMGFIGVSLNIGTAIISAICIGIAVDDTIHFLVSYRQHLAELGDPRPAIFATMREVGRPIIITSVVVVAGFGVETVSAFQPIFDFAVLSVTAILLALVGDLLLLPACLMIFKPRIPLRATAKDPAAAIE